jgi:hypothetical protein
VHSWWLLPLMGSHSEGLASKVLLHDWPDPVARLDGDGDTRANCREQRAAESKEPERRLSGSFFANRWKFQILPNSV